MVTTIDFDNSFQRRTDEIRDITERNVLMPKSPAQLFAAKMFLQDRFSFSGYYVGILCIPSGAESRPLQRIQHLFFDLFQFIFHLYHYVLHLSLIAFRPRGIDFPTHFLGYKAELLALSVALVHRFPEIL